MNPVNLRYKWNAIPWSKIERNVFKLQKRIYRAKCRGNVRLVRQLQKLLSKSRSARLLATRKVTQDNRGKKTAGVDGVKSIDSRNRLKLANNIKLDGKAKPVRRIEIPKPGKTEKRPLGIPTIEDRIKQTLVKLALEPEWEAVFEPNSYGFRPGRGCHDAIEAIFSSIRFKPKYVLDADIAQCFDKIDHKKLLDKLNTYPSLRRQIKVWLKAGFMSNNAWFPTEEGTPQGGAISPLLANIALHGMEDRIKEFATTLKGTKLTNLKKLQLIRYADDFVILHDDLEVILQCKAIISEWLENIGLELKPEKTSITHTYEAYNGKTGFDFLGFNIRQYKHGRHTSGKNPQGKLMGFKTIIKPSKNSIQRVYRTLAAKVEKLVAVRQDVLVKEINPIVRGWCNYYSTSCANEAFSLIQYLLFWKLKRWGLRRHHNKSSQWVNKKYWFQKEGNNWVFGEPDTCELIDPRYTEIKRHTKVRGNASPFDGDDIYWATRLGRHPQMPIKISKLLKKQKGKCNICGLTFKDGDVMEVDHIIPKSKGGKNEYKNYQLLHGHCHDTKTLQDFSTNDNSQIFEEPDEAKVSRPVLKTSRKGDLPA
ncbi:group II intron reverse transcriptase/maturase [Roseofilum casamattae]|uniref:Group II intron reverse transcriptase/maturase n=1 Tax=Roseofilum casamattae BLCC-M143 TaxID=3022442 RepID=A0ABT7BW09_9CYAN|nr:group II intron reverse transcriptase/maturase [Roseofilum casamattae]MDJ1183361.1 group II intron reverse transcriptase/maturase [Roseofilum casamattae BLCC-M143]